jgi:hypothetical protein
MSKRGCSINWEVVQSFKKFKDTDFKEERAECKFCGLKRAWQATDLQRHLNNCQPYINQQDALEAGQIKQRQMKLIVSTIGSSIQHNLKLCFAQAVVIDSLPLNAFDSRKDLCKVLSLLNNKFCPSSA